jgi:LmbE family N-acetylglucosaminyl deacetylase
MRIKGIIKILKIRILYLLILLKNDFKKQEGLNTILILCPHPDDEVLGLGGFILRMYDDGRKINIIYLTDGENSGVWDDKAEICKRRIAFSEFVCSNIGINKADIYRLHLQDGSIPHPGQPGFEESVKRIKKIIESVRPDAVFASHYLDYWPFDHVAAAHIAREAVIQSDTRPELWYYWVWAWYNIRPWQILGAKHKNLQKIDISDQLKRKMKLTDIYLSSLTPDGKPWSGILPDPLLKAFKYPFEIVERIL